MSNKETLSNLQKALAMELTAMLQRMGEPAYIAKHMSISVS